MGIAQRRFCGFTGDAFGAQIDQHDMALGAATDDAKATLSQGFRQDVGVFQNLLLIGFEAWLKCFFECHCFGRDDMHQGAALQTGEHRAVDGFFMRGFHQNDAAARSAQTFVRGGGDHIGMRHRVGVDARRDQTCVMRHVHQKNGADFFGHFGETREVDVQAVSRCPCNDQLGASG